MYKLLFLGIVIILGMILAPFIADNQGRVVIEFIHYRYEMSFVVLVVGAFLCFFILYIALSLLAALFSAPFSFGRWFKFKNPTKSLKQLESAQQLYIAGDYEKAGDSFFQFAKKNQLASSYLEACSSYLALKNWDKAKQSLDEAAKICNKTEQFSFRLMQLRYWIAIKKYDDATKLAKKLFNLQPRNLLLIKLSYQLYKKSENEDELIELFTAMQKVKLFDEVKLRQIELKTYKSKITKLYQAQGIEQVQSWWNDQPRATRKDPDILSTFNEIIINGKN